MPDGLVRLPSVQLTRYEVARLAIADCARIDEAAEIHDKAAAMTAYARLRDDRELEGWVAEIKCRAVIRIGQLSRELEKAAPANGHGAVFPSGGKTKGTVLREAGISTSAAHRYEEIAEADEADPSRAEQYYEACKEGGKAPTISGLRSAMKGDRRDERERELAAKTEEVSRKIGKQLYSVILADPPWRFESYSALTGSDRAADNHYPTMTFEELLALEPRIPAAKDCALFLWATAPMLQQAMALMEGWAFTYRSHWIWVKDRAGTGYWNRSKHELLLLGVKGHIPAPAPGDQYESVIHAKVGRHSQKPGHFIEMIDDMFPNQVGLEMFAREARTGWDSWGNEV